MHKERDIRGTASRGNRKGAACNPADCASEVALSIGLGTSHHAGPVYGKAVYLPRPRNHAPRTAIYA